MLDRKKIQAIIKNEIENLAAQKLESCDEEIFKSGFLDSLNVLNIIVFIEQEFNIKVDVFEVNIDSLGTVNKMVDYVWGKRESSSI